MFIYLSIYIYIYWVLGIYIYIYVCVCVFVRIYYNMESLVWFRFYDISTFVGYLTPNPFYVNSLE